MRIVFNSLFASVMLIAFILALPFIVVLVFLAYCFQRILACR